MASAEVAKVPRVSLSRSFRITRGSGVWVYKCRDCWRRYEWERRLGSYKELPVAMQTALHDHAMFHLTDGRAGQL